MRSYNFTDCTPIGKYTETDVRVLEGIYRIKLKRAGFQDIEAWSSNISQIKKKVKTSPFIRGHIRWSVYKTKDVFNRLQNETSDYLRVLEYAAYNGFFKQKQSIAIQLYVMNGSLHLACKEAGIDRSSFTKYLHRNLKELLSFYNRGLDE